MSSELSLLIKDYHNGGGDLKLIIKGAITSEKRVGSTQIIKLTITRTPDKHSSRLGMFASIRNTQKGYQSLGFSEVTVIFDKVSDYSFSRTIEIFYNVAVLSVKAVGNDEEIAFIAGSKTDEIKVI